MSSSPFSKEFAEMISKFLSDPNRPIRIGNLQLYNENKALKERNEYLEKQVHFGVMGDVFRKKLDKLRANIKKRKRERLFQASAEARSIEPYVEALAKIMRQLMETSDTAVSEKQVLKCLGLAGCKPDPTITTNLKAHELKNGSIRLTLPGHKCINRNSDSFRNLLTKARKRL